MLNNLLNLPETNIKIGSLNLTLSVPGVIEILLFTVLSYYIIIWIKRTKAWTLLKGVLVLVGFYLIAKFLGLNNVAYLFETSVGSIVIAAIVIFQPELRKALERLGERKMFRGFLGSVESTGLNSQSIDSIVRAISQLGNDKIGALIVVERSIDLEEYINTGIRIDAMISTALLEQIFEHNTPLHDGAVIIRDNRIVAATCYLPLSQATNISKQLGTRHRAGLGLSEATDAIVLIASEETGALSIAMDGRLQHGVSADQIRETLSDVRFSKEEERDNPISLQGLFRSWKERRKNER